MSHISDLSRLANEQFFEWKLRCCKAKINRETDLDWSEIAELLGLDVSADHLRKTAYGIMEYDEYLHGGSGIATRILSISDLHVPFQLPVTTFSDYAGKVDILQINGDVIDCQSLSKFPKTYRISPMEEIIQGRQYLIDLITYINPKKVVINYGNHDARFGAYLAKNLDSDILELMPSNSLELILVDGFTHYDKRTLAKTKYEPLVDMFDGIEIQYVDDWKVKIGKTWFLHPMAYRSKILGTCERAMEYLHTYDKESFDLVVMAHTHAVGDAKRGFIRLIEQGCCADVTKMRYMDGKLCNPQKMGFCYVAQDENGNVINDKTKVITLN